MSSDRTIIVGGGIVGACAAYYLAKRGRSVVLVEKGDVSDSASAGNAGIIAVGHPPLPRPGLARQALRWMFDGTSPLFIPPRADLRLLLWMWDFQRACRPDRVRRSMRVLAEMGRESLRCWHQIMADEALDCPYHRDGWLDVYCSDKGRRSAEDEAAVVAEHGFDVRRIEGAELRSRQAGFGDDVLGAVHYTESTFLDPGRFLQELIGRLPALGVEVRRRAEVARLLVRNGRCRGVALSSGEEMIGAAVVLAAGVWSSQLARAIGLKLPMQAGKGYHLDLTRPKPCIDVACVLNESFVAVNPMTDRLRLAGTVEFSGVNDRLIPQRLQQLEVAARRYLRGIDGTQIVSRWCGLRPCTADGLPVIDRAPGVAGLFIATGHAKMGLTHGPVTGRLIAELIVDGQPSLDLAPLRADRF